MINPETFNYEEYNSELLKYCTNDIQMHCVVGIKVTRPIILLRRKGIHAAS